MTITKFRSGFTLIEILIAIALIAIVGVLLLGSISEIFRGKPTVPVTNAITTMVMQVDQNPIDVDASGNSATSGSLLVLLNAPPGTAQQPTKGTQRTIQFTVFPHHPSGTVTISPKTGLTGMIGVVNFTLSTSQYEGSVTIIGVDSATGEAGVITVTVR